jgi:hypothetical protein
MWGAQVDAPSQNFDPWLASTTPVDTDGDGQPDLYRHASDIFFRALGVDVGIFHDVPAMPVDAPGSGKPYWDDTGRRWLADADGDRTTDSVVVYTGVRDQAGNYFYVAARVVDLSALVNVSTVGEPSTPEPFFPGTAAKQYLDAVRGGPVTDLDWSRLGLNLPLNDDGGLHHLRIMPWRVTSVPLKTYNNAVVRMLRNLPSTSTAAANCNFGHDDLLSLLWREPNINRSTCRTRGRLYEAIPQYGAARPYLTTWSTSRNLAAQVARDVAGERLSFTYDRETMARRVDLNQAVANQDDEGHKALFNAFYNAIPRDRDFSVIPEGIFGFTRASIASNDDMDRLRRCIAAQMTVNVIDFADEDGAPTFCSRDTRNQPLIDGARQPLTVCGIERQPFITEAFHKKTGEVVNDEVQVQQYCAVELYNPYVTGIPLDDYAVRIDGTESASTFPPGTILQPGARVVLVNNRTSSEIPLAPFRRMEIQGLDLDDIVEIVRKTPAGDVYIGSIQLEIEPGSLDPAGAGGKAIKEFYRVARRDDTLSRARYTVAKYKKETFTDADIAEGKDLTAATSLDAPNNLAADDAAFTGLQPTPVYVRNGGFINLGDLLRIFRIGPGAAPIDVQLAEEVDAPGKHALEKLAAGRWAIPPAGKAAKLWWFDRNGRLIGHGKSHRYVPGLPVACLLTGYFTVNNPCDDEVDNNRKGNPAPPRPGVDEDTEGAIYGMVNVNTAPLEVLRCLVPTWDYAPPQADRVFQADKIARAIRDYLDAKPPLQRAYAVPGEVLIAVRNAAPVNNSYEAGAPNYKLADDGASDDGLGRTRAEEVKGDLAKYQIAYSRMSNLITVRSDSFAVYLTVMRFRPSDVETGKQISGTNVKPYLREPTAIRRYVGVLDRSECYKGDDWPEIRMFGEIK